LDVYRQSQLFFSSRSFNIFAVTVGEVHIVALLPLSGTMSFQRSSALESQPTTWRREDDASYADDPEFRDFAEKLSDDLFALTRNVARLSQETAKLGTKHETARVRERVKTTVEETSEKFKELGEGLKKVTTWPDVGVRWPPSPFHYPQQLLTHTPALAKVHAVQASARI